MTRHPSTRLAIALGMSLGTTGGCFSGADALHLPCERDEDCGRGQSCIAAEADPAQKFCDGPPDTFGPTGTTGSGPATESGSTTLPATSDSGGSSSGGDPIPLCGDQPDPGWECNEGDPAPDGPGVCTDACRFPIFVDEFEPGVPKWKFSASALGVAPPGVLAGLSEVPDGFGIDGVNQWMDIETYTPPDALSNVDGGVAFAFSDPIPLPELPANARWELHFSHRFNAEPADSCGVMQSLHTDGGHVALWVEGSEPAAFFLSQQLNGTSLSLLPDDDPTSCVASFMRDPNPLGGELGYVGFVDGPLASGLVETGFELPIDDTINSIRIVFVMSYDCANCWLDPVVEPGWRIDDVEVAAHRLP